LTAGPDLAAAEAATHLANPMLDLLAGAVAVAFSFEATCVYAAVAVIILWRGGAGLWSFAPFLFVPLAAVEVALKLTISQAPVPAVFHRSVPYPAFHLVLPGSYPSGHAMRIAFACFFAIAASYRRPMAVSLLVCAALVLGMSRVYLGEHWLSDVVGGLVLGSATGLVAGASARHFAARWPPFALGLKR